MTGVSPAAASAPVRWPLRPDVEWFALIRDGPQVFDVYVRVAWLELSDDDNPSDDHTLAAHSRLSPSTRPLLTTRSRLVRGVARQTSELSPG